MTNKEKRVPMIREVARTDLRDCLAVFHKGYGTVAEEFGLTEDNCPDRGRASLPFEKLLAGFEQGTLMFCYTLQNRIVAFLGIRLDGAACKLDDIVVLPAYRGKGIGEELLAFCKRKAMELGASEIYLGMIDDNVRLKTWYEAHGFVNTGYKKYEKAPFTVGYMRCVLL